jgi:RpiB/LacA/LacB family sugar-phosphate isomerase
MKTVLFVCTGNICRSPMAEGLFRHATKGHTQFRVLSAGVGAVDGLPPSEFAVRALKELGIDIAKQRSRMLTADLVNQADYIFGMTHSHVDAITLLYPHAAEKTFLLREFDETLESYENDISDPIGGSYEVYLNCRDQIEQGIASMLKFIEQTASMHATDRDTAKTAVALGADHGGFQLKQAIKQHLQSKGLPVTDYGTTSTDSTDYPDYAQAVARSVAEHQHHFGILICTSGVGMSIAANKVPGARAALVWDVEAAAMARRHNDANILCLSAKSTQPDQIAAIVDTFLATPFEGGRHERRVGKLETSSTTFDLRLKNVDSAIASAIDEERQRQQNNIELIASENFQPRGDGSAGLRPHQQIR